MKIGMDAIVAAGLPHEFIALAMLKSYELNVSLAIRCGQPPNTCKGFTVSPKPIKLKTKTCSDDQHLKLLSGFIAWDQSLFGRSTECPIPEKEFKPVQLYVSLCEVLKDAAENRYKNLTLRVNHLEFTAEISATEQIKFSLDLDKPKQSIQYDSETLTLIDPWHPKSPVEKPEFWHKNLGCFNHALKNLYPVSFSLSNHGLKPLMVAATLDGIPITGDIDILWGGIPVDFSESMNHKHYNTANENELNALLSDYQKLCEQIIPNSKNLFLDDVEAFAKHAGIITPYELIIEKLINDEFAKRIPYVRNFLQHGPETNNPGKPSSLDGKMLHLFDGMPVLTENEDELIQLIMRPGYLEKYYIYIHPCWNITKWECVIRKQLELGQHVNDQTLNNYYSFKNDKKDHTKKSFKRFGYKELAQCGMTFYQQMKHHYHDQDNSENYIKNFSLAV